MPLCMREQRGTERIVLFNRTVNWRGYMESAVYELNMRAERWWKGFWTLCRCWTINFILLVLYSSNFDFLCFAICAFIFWMIMFTLFLILSFYSRIYLSFILFHDSPLSRKFCRFRFSFVLFSNTSYTQILWCRII